MQMDRWKDRSVQIDHTSIIDQPRIVLSGHTRIFPFCIIPFRLRCFSRIRDVAAVGFSKVILQCPNKISDQKRMCFCIPHCIDIHRPSCFCPKQNSLRMELMKNIIFIFIVVVSRNIQKRIEIFCRFLVHFLISRRIVHILFILRDICGCSHKNFHIMIPVCRFIFR